MDRLQFVRYLTGGLRSPYYLIINNLKNEGRSLIRSAFPRIHHQKNQKKASKNGKIKRKNTKKLKKNRIRFSSRIFKGFCSNPL